MTRTMATWVSSGAMIGAVLLGAPGCDRSCGTVFRCPLTDETGGAAGTGGTGGSEPTGGGGSGGMAGTGGMAGSGGTVEGYTCPDDPSDGEVREECGVWVSVAHGNDLNEGTQSAPVQTLAAAIKLAAEPGATRRVYACGEVYEGPVHLPAGISLFGGFTGCDGAGKWIYKETEARATILGVPDSPALVLLEGNDESLLAEVEIQAPDATLPGGSSIGVFAPKLAKARFRRSLFLIGDGVDGLDGEPGDPLGMAAPLGLDGAPGADACTMDPGQGGPAPALQCDGGVTAGGKGGNGGAIAAGSGGDGVVPPSPNTFGYGKGGEGEGTGLEPACTSGSGGAQGENGEDGLGAPYGANGQITLDGRFIGAPGADGTPGKPGQGGGGGGASIGKAAVCAGSPEGGAGGSSGGTGGCGGRAGKGGQAGGSSLGIIGLGYGVNVEPSSFMFLGNGGRGGDGGAPQVGGLGGLPGKGGKGVGDIGGVKAGCAGGVGGTGGNGGSGGGGRGGHTSCSAWPLGAHVYDVSDCHRGKGGEGGKAGANGKRSGNGEHGEDNPAVILGG